MKALKDRIQAEGQNLGSGILKIDSLLNHQIYPDLMMEMGKEMAARFAGVKVDRILTAEISGIAPALTTGVLPGVTRAAVGALAREAGYRVREGAFPLGGLVRAQEAFTSSAVREIVPVAAVDGTAVRRGEAAGRLQELLEGIDGDPVPATL